MTDHVTVVETRSYLSDAAYAGMTENDRAAAVLEVAMTPDGGDSLGGGLYKVRIARPGRGKSKGWRILVAYVGEKRPAYLLAVFAKGDRANLTKKEVEALQAEIKKELGNG